MEIAYRGECMCSVNNCTHKAYYEGVLCGRHCPKEKRKYLPKNPNEKQNAPLAIQEKLKKAVISDKPVVTATKMRMMQTPVPKDGFLLVCPNNKHGHNFGYPGNYSSLSPMQLGPVVIDGVFVAHQIENYHQFAKVFPDELSDIPCDCGRPFAHEKPLPVFFETRKRAYGTAHGAVPAPQRHKQESKGKNVPAYSIQCDTHYTYIESRYFYCTQMEVLATQRDAFKELLEKYTQGYSLDIHGYDAYTPDGVDAQTLYKHYCDGSRPFGHEMVILALLVLHKTPDEYPWKIYKREHEDIYQCLQNKKHKY